MNNKVISDRLKRHRKNKRLTQEQLANKLDVSTSVISGAESDKRGVSKKLAIKLAKFFNTDTEYWINPNAEKELIESSTGLDTLNTILDRLVNENIVTDPNDVEKDKELNKIIMDSLKLEVLIKLKKKQG